MITQIDEVADSSRTLPPVRTFGRGGGILGVGYLTLWIRLVLCREAVRVMPERLDLQEAGASARLESRF